MENSWIFPQLIPQLLIETIIMTINFPIIFILYYSNIYYFYDAVIPFNSI